MVQLVDKNTLQVLTTKENIERWGGPIGDAIERGDYVWCDVPAGVNPKDTVVQAGPPVAVVEDATKKAARLADEATEATKRQQARDALQEIRDFDETTATAAQVRQFQRNIKRVLTYLFRSI